MGYKRQGNFRFFTSCVKYFREVQKKILELTPFKNSLELELICEKSSIVVPILKTGAEALEMGKCSPRGIAEDSSKALSCV